MRLRILARLILLPALWAVAIGPMSAGTPWKLILKSGSTIECDGVPVIVNGNYLYRGTNGKDGSITSAQVDTEKTNRANHVDSPQPIVTGSTSGIAEITDSTFGSEVLAAKGTVLVNFYVTWCPVCRRNAPVLAGIANEYTGRLKVVQMDAEANDVTAQKYDVDAYPTLVLFRNGSVVRIAQGGLSHSEYVRFLGQRR